MNFWTTIQQEELDFIDREFINKKIHDEYQKLKYSNDYFQIFLLYGMGGIGKTRLLKEIQKNSENYFKKDSKFKCIHVSYEISKNDDILNACVQLRKKIDKACPLFDYALLTLWNRMQISKLDDDFMKTVADQIYSLVSIGFEFISITPMPKAQFISLPLSKLLDILKRIFDYYKLQYYGSRFTMSIKNIDSFSSIELLGCLSGFLGLEINRLFYNSHLLVIIDSFEQIQRSPDADWLISLIENAAIGLFVIASREKLNIPNSIKEHVSLEYQLDQLPEPYVRSYLMKKTPLLPSESIDNVITITQGIPIYLDLAVNTYSSMLNKQVSFLQPGNFLFNSKTDLVRQFFSHLEQSIQDFLFVISTVQIFDRDIFEYLAIALNAGVNVLQYQDISSISLVYGMESDSHFCKVHDVITANVIEVLPEDTRYRIFKSYMICIHDKTIFLLTDTQKALIFCHLLKLIDQNNFKLQQSETEKLLDIFFIIKQTLVPVYFDNIPGISASESLKYIYPFLKAVYEEREDTKIRLTWLKDIDVKECQFGKHIKSLQIIQGYLNQWLGNKSVIEDYLFNTTVLQEEVLEWYYAQTKIFLGDYLTIKGDFKNACAVLKQFCDELKCYPEQHNSLFQIYRHLGHIYRFNFQFDEAIDYYNRALTCNTKEPSLIQKIYIYTNLCETNCYTNPDEVLSLYCKALKMSKSINDLKSISKIYYSTAIALLHKKKYKRAKKFIRKSFFYDELDGYALGQLNPLLAELYLQKSLSGEIDSTVFQALQTKVEVYGFLNLGPAILMDDHKAISQIQLEYNWIDFSKTVENYKLFFQKLDIFTVS